MGDVARLAGVSRMTVSRVLNDHPSVSTATRARVRAAMTSLDYRPNTAARALVTGRTRVLGVISVNSVLYGPASMLVAIERAARDAGYSVSLANPSALDRHSFAEAMDHLRSQSVAGIIAIAPQVAAPGVLRDAPAGIPVVGIEGGGDAVPTVSVDQYLGARSATRYLLSLGHRVVGHVAGPPDSPEAAERERGWRETLAADGYQTPPVARGDWSPRSGYEATRQLTGIPGLTALFVANDQMAIGAVRALKEAQLRVPRDISVIGFDDIPEAGYLSPSLTTLRQDFGEIGRRSLALLLEQLHGAPRSSKRVVIPPDLVVRESTDAPGGTSTTHGASVPGGYGFRPTAA
jgi:DNA-binding LacI/PurR family transcriptional regulator